MSKEKKNNKLNKIDVVLLILAILIVISGGYVLFFKNKKDDRYMSDDMIMQQYGKIEFTDKVSGQSGDLYLDQNGRVYFALSDFLKDDKTLMSFVRTFKTIKNDVYNSTEIKAILLNALNVMGINYIVEDTVQDSYYLLTMSGGKQMLIYDYEIMGKQIINIVENIEHNAKIDEFNGVYLARLGDGKGADIEAIIGEEKTDDILIGVKQGSISIYRKKDGKNYIKEDDGTEKEITPEVEKTLSETAKSYVKTVNDYSDKTYGKNMENLPPENKIVKLTEQVSKDILDKYGIVKTKEYMEKKDITLDKVVNSIVGMPATCNCMGYSGFKDEDYNICRDVTGLACWTPDEGYINPYLRPTIDEKTGLYSTDTRVDISYTAEHNDKKMQAKIQDAVKSGSNKWWVYINGKLTVAEPSPTLSKADTGLYKDRLSGKIAGFECYGSAEDCKRQLKSHVQSGDLDSTTIEDVDNLFETGHKVNYVDPKDYHTTDLVGDDKKTEQKDETEKTCIEKCNMISFKETRERCINQCNGNSGDDSKKQSDETKKTKKQCVAATMETKETLDKTYITNSCSNRPSVCSGSVSCSNSGPIGTSGECNWVITTKKTEIVYTCPSDMEKDGNTCCKEVEVK